MTMFYSTYLQTATYLLGVCLFSIFFAVFLNSSISFVLADRLGFDIVHDDIGNAIGTLAFVDELLAIVACPLWGILSDIVGAASVSLPHLTKRRQPMD